MFYFVLNFVGGIFRSPAKMWIRWMRETFLQATTSSSVKVAALEHMVIP